ncbi:hypothetical protein, partial [Nocardia alni]|uniref:hypothetical protein n=1 Tax=Nocardia alni TaxID=2815723 RepID=UPI001C249491
MTDLDALLDAPTPVAARVLEEASTADRWWQISGQQCDMFAQNHSWVEAAACLRDPRIRLRVAHARVLRGESIGGQYFSAERPGGLAAGEVGFWAVPLGLRSWEARHWDSRY